MHNVKGPNISVTSMGIKCDTPSCDFVDMSVKVEDYHLWLNRPCPKCGANLLTQADYDTLQKQLKRAEMINKLKLPEHMQHPRVRMTCNYDGSGTVMYSEMELIEE